jgi:hypothetical protein
MLSEDASWFQIKNRRLILELLAILNYLKSQKADQSKILSKINYIKNSDISHLESVFLSPEGRQWISFSYREIKKSLVADSLLEEYAKWLGISRIDLLKYLIGKLDLFILSLAIYSKRNPSEIIALKLYKMAVIPGLECQLKSDDDLVFLLNPKDKISVVESANGTKAFFRNDNGETIELSLKKIPRSDNYAVYVDLVSEVSRINFPGREHLPRISSNDHKIIIEQIKVIDKAIDYIRLFDSSIYQYFKEVKNYFVPLQGPEGALPSSSNSSVDTMFWYSKTKQPLLMAEMIIHEYSHQRVFRLQDIDPLIDPSIHGTGWDRCEIYSPWRDDPRPVNGVFHGFIVFTETSRFWITLIKKGELDDIELDISSRRLAMLVLQLKYAKESLDGCKFTSPGKNVFSYYAKELDEELLPYINDNQLQKLKPYFMEYHDQEILVGSSILDVVDRHKSQWKIRNGNSK